MNHKILRLPAVQAVTGLSRSAIYQKMAEATFPKSINLGARSIGWLEADVDHWIEQQILASRKVAHAGAA